MEEYCLVKEEGIAALKKFDNMKGPDKSDPMPSTDPVPKPHHHHHRHHTRTPQNSVDSKGHPASVEDEHHRHHTRTTHAPQHTPQQHAAQPGHSSQAPAVIQVPYLTELECGI